MFHENVDVFKTSLKLLWWCFKVVLFLNVFCCMSLIAATRAEGGFVLLSFIWQTGGHQIFNCMQSDKLSTTKSQLVAYYSKYLKKWRCVLSFADFADVVKHSVTKFKVTVMQHPEKNRGGKNYHGPSVFLKTSTIILFYFILFGQAQAKLQLAWVESYSQCFSPPTTHHPTGKVLNRLAECFSSTKLPVTMYSQILTIVNKS